MTCAILAGLVAAGLGFPAAARADTTATTEFKAGLLFDNNAALGRRGLFGADPVVDVTSIFALDTDIRSDITKRIKGLMNAKLKLEEFRKEDFLRNSEFEMTPGLEFTLTDMAILRPTLRMKLHREKEHIWGYVEVAPSLFFQLFTKKGIVFEAGYDFTWTEFDAEELTNTYANVDRMSHLLKTKTKLWQTKKIRHQLKVEVEYASYDKNIEERLAHISFANATQFEDPDLLVVPIRRNDVLLRTEYEFLVVPFKWGAAAVAYRFEYTHSNLTPFLNIAHGPRVALTGSSGMHEAFIEAKVTFLDFPNFEYDSRFSDTKRDVRVEAFAAYVISFAKGWKAALKGSIISNFSNDAQEDAGGALLFDPRHSLSFSRYQGLRIEAMISYTWSTEKKKAVEKKPEPRLPGTILARRW